ncbi:MAG: outer membrane beta-barrel protein [Pseudomonadota bacterium]|nr:outer membrane beta-barrel protein [Pseudomonadota bacterium]
MVKVEGASMQPVRFLTITGFLMLMGAGGAEASNFAAPAPGFPPDATDVFHIFVGDQETYDDNLFRLPPHTVGVPGAVFANAAQSDAINTSSVGAQGRWDVARQNFEIDLRADENRFKNNSALDFVSANAMGTWNWRAGPYFSGRLETLYDRSLASFGQTRFSGKDILTSVQESASARYQLGPHWAAYGEVRGSYTQHSAEIERFNDFHNKAGNAGVQYVSGAADTYSFEYQYVNITFNQGLANQAYNYKEDSARLLLHYGLSDKTVLDGYGGYLRRRYPGLAIGAYSGAVGRAAVTYSFTEKTQLMISGWHELHAYIDAESNYFIAQGVSLSPIWNPTEKLSFNLLASYENQDYIASNSVIVASPRHDKLNAEQATIRYTPRDALIFTVFLRHEKRESNQYVFSYGDNVISGSVTFKFL